MPAQKESRTRRVPRPEAIVDFIFENGMFFISIENIGDLPALNVTTIFDRKLMGLHGSRDISTLPLFQRIEFLAPHKAIRTLLDSSSSYFGRNEPTRITARITYSDSSSKKYQATIHHDLNIYKDISYIPEVNKNGRSA